jgi:chromosome segregation ATPase
MTKLEEIDAKITELRSQLDKLYKERKKIRI